MRTGRLASCIRLTLSIDYTPCSEVIESPQYRNIERCIIREIEQLSRSTQSTAILTLLGELELLQRNRSDGTARLSEQHEAERRQFDSQFDQREAQLMRQLEEQIEQQIRLPQTNDNELRDAELNTYEDVAGSANNLNSDSGNDRQFEGARPQTLRLADLSILPSTSRQGYNEFDEASHVIGPIVPMPMGEEPNPLTMQPAYEDTFGPMPPGGFVQPTMAQNNGALEDAAESVEDVSPENSCPCGQACAGSSTSGSCKAFAELFEFE